MKIEEKETEKCAPRYRVKGHDVIYPECRSDDMTYSASHFVSLPCSSYENDTTHLLRLALVAQQAIRPSSPLLSLPPVGSDLGSAGDLQADASSDLLNWWWVHPIVGARGSRDAMRVDGRLETKHPK